MGHSTTEEMSAVQRERGEKIVFDNSKCIRTSKGGGVNFQFPMDENMDVFCNDPMTFFSSLAVKFVDLVIFRVVT
jgi:hypothetical protein